MSGARVVAGIDVGNATTEVVLADISTSPPRPVGWDRAPTRGRKGSAQAALGAAALVGRLSRRAGAVPDAVATVPQRPTDTTLATVPRSSPVTGRVAVLTAAARTPGRPGVGAGRPVLVTAAPMAGTAPVVLLVAAALGYAEAARRIDRWVAAGAALAGVLVEADEGVLVASRIAAKVPVLDGVPVAVAASCELVALEVAEPGRSLRTLADPVRLRALLDGVPPQDARAAARAVADAGSAAVAVRSTPVHAPGAEDPAWAEDAAWVEDAAGRAGLLEAVEAVRASAPGRPRRLRLPGRPAADVEDLWLVDLAAAAADVEARRPHDQALGIVAAALAPHDEASAGDARRVLAEALGVPVVAVPGEAAAARAGALSTPGTDPGATVLALGGGTVDAMSPSCAAVVVAGAGEAVTEAVAAVLDIPRGAADWVKRGPAARLEGPHLLLAEDGTRTFTEVSATLGVQGCLVVPGPAGWLPFSRELAPAEWRALRLHLKRVTLGDNVSRCLRALGDEPAEIVLVGGVAGDEEVLRVLDRAAPGALVGRADVAGGVRPGSLGHRWAVAYGAVLLAG